MSKCLTFAELKYLAVIIICSLILVAPQGFRMNKHHENSRRKCRKNKFDKTVKVFEFEQRWICPKI